MRSSVKYKTYVIKMVSRLSKLSSHIVVPCAVFIFLSVSSAERTRCYWCGPLAEQVHRSQRAPPCEPSPPEQHQHETFCDEGYSHCAVVAVSPPYTESRLCVKFYQDECYSLYCNSTKTWRMVCACRGDLCNGPLTARETQAFALLPKFKPKHKRNLVSHFISVKTRTPTNVDTIIIMKENETIQSDQPIPNENTSHLYTPTPKRDEDNIIIVHGTLNNFQNSSHASSKLESANESNMHSPEPTNVFTDLDDAKIHKHHKAEVNQHLDNDQPKNKDDPKVDMHIANVGEDKNLSSTVIDKDIVNTELDKHIDKAKVDVVKNIANATVDKHVENTKVDKDQEKITEKNNLTNVDVDKQLTKPGEGKPDNAEINKPTKATTTMTAETKESHDALTTTILMKPTIEIIVQSSPTPNKMPPAEALQQNVIPTKTIELTTMATVAMSTENDIQTTLPTETNTHKSNKKNKGAQNVALFTILVISFIVHYCI